MLSTSRFLLSFAAPYRFQLFLVGALTLASSLVMLAVPWLAGHAISGVIAANGSGTASLVATLLGALTALALLNFAMSYVSGRTATRLLADLRLMIYEHLQRLPLEFHERGRLGDILALMTTEITFLSDFLMSTLASTPSRIITVIGAVVLMIRIDPALALLAPILFPIYYVILRLIGRRLRGLARERQQAEAEMVGIAEENLQILPAIKAFAREEHEANRYRLQIGRASELVWQERKIHAALQPVLSLIAAGSAVLLLMLAGQSLRTGAMTSAEMFSFLFYAALLTQPASQLALIYGQIQTARGALARLQSVLREDPEPGYAASGMMQSAKGEIEFKQVCFAYPDRHNTLDNLNLHIAAGETVALIGQNGAGKSTIISLLLRFYDPVSGVITLDGRDITTIQLQELRKRIGLVPQRPLLFNGTIRENVAFGFENADESRIEAAVRLSQAHDFIRALPNGFDTVIGDHGIKLSGGQRQRIALARALIKDPQILILDEATSMYDLEGESAFVEASITALAGRTVILVTHRPGSLALADRVITLENGTCCEVDAAVYR